MNIENKGTPRISIIIPVRNEERFLAECLESILANDVPKESYEILVADGLSEDGTREVAESFRKIHPALKVIENPERIASTALNRGLREACGDIVIRIDGHGQVAPDFIRKSVETLERVPEAGCAGGNIEPRGKSFMGNVIALAQASFFGGGGGSWYRGRKAGAVDTVFNAAYRRSVFERVGFFDETLVRDQDDEFNYRLRQAGYKIYFNPEIRGHYYSRESLGKLAKQYLQYGFWKVKVLKKHRQMMQVRQFVPPLFISAFVFFAVGGLVFEPARVAFWFLMGAYLICSFLTSLSLGFRKGWLHAYPLPLAFAAMHFGYGIGFWAGVLYFGLIHKEPPRA